MAKTAQLQAVDSQSAQVVENIQAIQAGEVNKAGEVKINLDDSNHYTRIIQYVDSLGYRIDSTVFDDYSIMIIGTLSNEGVDLGRFFVQGEVLIGKGNTGCFRKAGDIKDGDFRCMPKYREALEKRVIKFCSSRIKKLQSNKEKALEAKERNTLKDNKLLDELI